MTAADIVPSRQHPTPSVEDVLRAHPGITYDRSTCTASDGFAIELAVFRAESGAGPGPGIVSIHGGGMVGGTVLDGLEPLLLSMERHGGTLISVGYRVAPEHPAPTPVEDCFAALTAVAARSHEFGIDPGRIVLSGGSAGGGLAAGVLLLARDRGGPAVLGAMLDCPMLDDRVNTVSARQFEDGAYWCSKSTETGWAALLGQAAGTDRVSPYDAPARATWLGGLPPLLIVVGSTDPFRDEDVAFASAVWRDGGECELYVLPGGPHGFEMMAPEAGIARAARWVRQAWIDRLLTADLGVAAHEGSSHPRPHRHA